MTLTTIPLPPPRSPWNYFQERYCSDPWKVLIIAMCLNQTSGKQLERVHERFFAKYTGPREASLADERMMATILQPLGFQNRRARAIMRMSTEYYIGRWHEPEELYGIGKYAADSYDIFVRGIVPDDVQDKELRRYLAWVEQYLSHEQVPCVSVTDVDTR